MDVERSAAAAAVNGAASTSDDEDTAAMTQHLSLNDVTPGSAAGPVKSKMNGEHHHDVDELTEQQQPAGTLTSRTDDHLACSGHETDRPGGATRPSHVTAGHYEQQRQRRVQRKSWAGNETSAEFHHEYHQHHLYQSESWTDISTTDPAAATTGQELVAAAGSMSASVFSSARRRLGRRREVPPDNDHIDGTTTSGGGGYELHRAPSSLFYLEYNDNDDDDDLQDEDEDETALWRRGRRKYSDNMPSSRKISAAAYLPRVPSVTSQQPSDTSSHTSSQITPTDNNLQQQQQQQQVEC